MIGEIMPGKRTLGKNTSTQTLLEKIMRRSLNKPCLQSGESGFPREGPRKSQIPEKGVPDIGGEERGGTERKTRSAAVKERLRQKTEAPRSWVGLRL